MKRHPRTHLTALLLGSGLCLSSLTGCGTEAVKQQQVQNTLAAAMQQAQIGRIPEARKWADRAIAIAPGDINTYIAAPTPDETGFIPDASDAPLGLVDTGGGEQGVFTSVGDDTDTVSYMTRAAARFPNSILPLQIMEEAQGRLGDTRGQQATAAKLAALIETQLTKPGHAVSADLFNSLAQAYWDAGDQAKGAADFRRVIATYPHDPSDITAYNGLAYEYAVVDDKAHLAEAATLAQTALGLAQRLNASDAGDSLIGDIQDTLGWVQYRRGDYRDALVNVQKCVDVNPRLPDCRYHLAMIYKALGNTGAARIEFGYAVKLSQGYAAAQQELEKLPASTPPRGTAAAGPVSSPPRPPALPAAANGPRLG